MRLRAISLLVLMLLVGACSDGGGDSGGGDSTDAGAPSVIRWPRTADHIVFRADVVGGADFDSFLRLGEVPLCTIYGDGRVVWVVDTAQGEQQTVFNIVTPEDIELFVSDVAITFDIYGQSAAADLVISEVTPVVEQLQIHVNEESHVTDIFADWDTEYFEEVIARCIETGDQPTIFEPSGAWLNVQATEFNDSSPLQRWDADITGVNLAEIASEGELVWVEGRLLDILWDLVERNPPDMQLDQDGQIFNIALQVPNITRDAPPAPGNA